jgi:O-antigen ligase
MATQPATNKTLSRKILSTFDVLCWRLLIWTLGLATPLMAALKPRRFIVGEVDFVEKSGGFSHLITLMLYAFFLLLAALTVANHLGKKKDQAQRRKVRTFWLLTVLLALMPTFTTMIVGGTIVWGSILFIVAVYSTTYFLPAPPLDWWIREVRVMLLALFVYGSLAAALLFPDWAWSKDYAAESAIAIFPMRLFGMTNHANALAPLASFAWLLGRFPGCRLRGDYVHGAAVLLVLLLSQSKTIWAVAGLLLCVQLLGKISSLGSPRKHLIYGTMAMVLMLGSLYLVKFSHYAVRIEDMLADPKLLTLTGRLPVWLIAVDMWLDQPWIGQGLEAWSTKAMLDYVSLLGWAAPHAHNQLLQVLSQTGLAGLGILLFWSLYYIRIVREAPAGKRIPLWWLSAFFALPGFTEVILQYGIGIGTTLLTWLVIAAVMIVGKTNTACPADKVRP